MTTSYSSNTRLYLKHSSGQPVVWRIHRLHPISIKKKNLSWSSCSEEASRCVERRPTERRVGQGTESGRWPAARGGGGLLLPTLEMTISPSQHPNCSLGRNLESEHPAKLCPDF